MSGRSVNVITLFLGRLRPPKQLTSTKVHILSPVTLLDSAERETKLSSRTGYRTSDLWFLSQTRSLLAYAKFHYSLNVLFCEPTENCEYKRKLYMYRVTRFRTMLTFTNYGSEAQTWLTEFESHRRRNSSYRKRCSNARRISLSF